MLLVDIIMLEGDGFCFGGMGAGAVEGVSDELREVGGAVWVRRVC